MAYILPLVQMVLLQWYRLYYKLRVSFVREAMESRKRLIDRSPNCPINVSLLLYK